MARRSYGDADEALRVRNLSVHEATMRVTVGDQPVELSRSEFELPCVLVKRVDRVVRGGPQDPPIPIYSVVNGNRPPSRLGKSFLAIVKAQLVELQCRSLTRGAAK